jgi:hypothetical protein
VDEIKLDDRLSGIGLQFTLDANDGLVRVSAIECGGPCWYYADARVQPGGGGGKEAALALVDKGMRQVEPFDILMAVDGTDIARFDGSEVLIAGHSRQEIAEMLVGATGSICRHILKSTLFRHFVY